MLTIAVVDAVTCILAGLAIFATLGYLANNQGKAVEDVIKQGLFNYLAFNFFDFERI